MNRDSIWHKWWVIVPALLIPPVGLFLLWRSSWLTTDKVYLTIVAVVVFAGAIGWGMHSDFYGLGASHAVPADGYDVQIDKWNRYRTPETLPLEREVFGAVVREMKKDNSVRSSALIDEATDSTLIESPAFSNVAEEFGLSVEDVAAIYRKVSSTIKPKS